MMASGGAIVGGKVLIGTYTDSINQDSLLGAAAAGENGQKSIEGDLNILMVGLDERPENDEPVRADSIIIMHVPASHDQAYLVSIPRDLYVTIPAIKKLHPNKEKSKINAAYAYGSSNGGRAGGVQVLAETVKGFSGITFNAAGIVNFGGFKDVVKALGGVDMCIDQEVDSHHIARDKAGNLVGRDKYPRAAPVHYEVGCRHLEAWEALDYVRQRYGLPNTDYDRARHQQQFLKAVFKRAKTQGLTSNPVKALKVMKAAGSALTVDTQGVDLATWAFTLRGVAENELVMLKVNAGTFNSVTLPDGSAAEQLSEESSEMLAALRADKLAEFVMAHPEFVASDTAS